MQECQRTRWHARRCLDDIDHFDKIDDRYHQVVSVGGHFRVDFFWKPIQTFAFRQPPNGFDSRLF